MTIAKMWKRSVKNDKNLDFHVHLKNRFLFLTRPGHSVMTLKSVERFFRDGIRLNF
jgi:hypothetical protein